MSISLEYRKIKRTGFLPAFLGGGILAAAVPIVNMAFRSEIYLTQQGTPIQVLLEANWQMMAMLNVLLVVMGACLLYHTEYMDNAMQKMKSLPIRESSLFFGKTILILLMSALVLAIEAGAAAFCSYHWFAAGNSFWNELCRNFGYAFLLMMPCVILSLLIAEACQNMWVSLGIGVICVFTATMLPADNFVLSLFPFAAPFQVSAGADRALAMRYVYASAAEFVFFCLAEPLFLRIRRSFS